jgi:cytochrome P450
MTTRVDRLDEPLTQPSFYSNPYPVYRRLREEDPVHWCAPWQQWIVTRHADVTEVLMSPERFSSSRLGCEVYRQASGGGSCQASSSRAALGDAGLGEHRPARAPATAHDGD